MSNQMSSQRGRATFTGPIILFAVILGPFLLLNLGRAEPPLQDEALFEKRCGGCHALDRDKEGPRLRGVYGRPSGAITSFNYSAPLKNAHLIWDDATLDKWLTDPNNVVPDTDMDFRLEKSDERRQIIAFLKATSVQPRKTP
jgi:cytochrome c